MLLRCARPISIRQSRYSRASTSDMFRSRYRPAHRQTRLLMGTYPHYAALWTSVFAGHGPSSLSHTDTSRRLIHSHNFFLRNLSHALTQQYGRSVVMVFWFFFTSATTCVSTGTAAPHTADSTGCDEVNSEHVPRPAGGGRVALERAAAAYSMRQGVNSLQTPRAGKHPWTPAGAFCRAAHLPVVRLAGVGDLHRILAQGQQASTRLLASSKYSPRHPSLADRGGAKWQRACFGWSAAAAMSRVSLLRRRTTAL
jgi:hypothetical protein